MKHLFKLSLLLLALLLPATATAHDFEVDGIYYIINGNEATVTFRGTSYNEYSNEYSGSVTIPSSVTYNGTIYSVTAIDDLAFFVCGGLTSVTIPNSVTSIGEAAFSGCSGLTRVTIGNSVTSIGRGAFSGCSGLTSLTIPNSVTSIGSSAFENCSSLASIDVPKSVISVGLRAFHETAWYNNQPDGLVYLGPVAYRYKGQIPELEEETEDEGTCIVIKEGTVCIADFFITSDVGFGFNGLTSVVIPNSVKSIGKLAFSDSRNLKNVSMGDSVVIIDDNAFLWCGALKSITIPNTVTSIGEYAFDGCGLARVYITDLNAWCNIKFANSSSNPLSGTRRLYLNGLEVTNLIIPNTVTSISNYAFYGCRSLESVTIPNSVASIGYAAFRGCSSLNSIKVESGNTTFDSRNNCNAIIETASCCNRQWRVQ